MTYLRHMYMCVSVCLCVCLCVSVCVSVCVYMYIRWDRALGRSPSWRVDQRVRKDPDGETSSSPLAPPPPVVLCDMAPRPFSSPHPLNSPALPPFHSLSLYLREMQSVGVTCGGSWP
jgi:hypothetical protein